jgi:hypothetical protein
MTRVARLAAALALLALAPGCIATTHMFPDPGPRRWNQIEWRKDFETARKESVATDKPLLTVVAAGARNGYC